MPTSSDPNTCVAAGHGVQLDADNLVQRVAARIRSRDERPDGSEEIAADLVISFKVFRERFGSRVTLWPEARRVNVFDDSLSVDRERDGELTEAMTRRIAALARYSIDAGAAGARQALMLEPRPTALFAANDIAALGVLNTVLESGLSVPQDVAVVGYDDMPQAGTETISLTTMRQPIDRMLAFTAALKSGQAPGSLVAHLGAA